MSTSLPELDAVEHTLVTMDECNLHGLPPLTQEAAIRLKKRLIEAVNGAIDRITEPLT